MRFLLDTNVISELRRPAPDRKVQNWLGQNEFACGICDVTIGELAKGAHRLREADRRTATLRWIHEIEKSFGNRLLPVTNAVFHRWGQISGDFERDGSRIPVLDSLIAATALESELTLVTRNTSDFDRVVDVFNPWN